MNDKLNEKLDNIQKILRFIIDIIFFIFFLFSFVFISLIEKIVLLPLIFYFIGRIIGFYKKERGNKISKISMTIFIIEFIIYFFLSNKI